MKIFADIFHTKRIAFKMMISPPSKGNPSTPGHKASTDDPLLTEYTSKKQVTSLIFNPKVALLIQCNDRTIEYNPDAQALVPIGLIYQLADTISCVHDSLDTKGLFHTDRELTTLNAALATQLSRKISLPRTIMTVQPAMINDNYNINTPGVVITASGVIIGAMTHIETRALVETIMHLDLTTYTLLAGTAESLVKLRGGQREILEKLSRIEDRLGISTPKNISRPTLPVEIPWSHRPNDDLK